MSGQSISPASLAPEGKKNVCTLYRDTACTSEESMVTFDHSHYDMFDNGDHREKTYIGGIVGSIKCEVVDASTAVSNTNGSPSTQHQSQCVGESCNSDNDCHRDATGSLYCSKHKSHSNTCQLARALPAGASCLETEQCEEGRILQRAS